jgi:excisionase family DNA binding protein
METKLSETTILTEKEAGKYLNISAETLRKCVRYKGLIPFVRVSKGIRYLKADLDAYIKSNRIEAVN